MTSEKSLIEKVEASARRLAEAMATEEFWRPRSTQAIEARYKQTLAAAAAQQTQALAQAATRQQQTLADARATYETRLPDVLSRQSTFVEALSLLGADWDSSAWATWQPSVAHLHPAAVRLGQWRETQSWHTQTFPAVAPLLSQRGWLFEAEDAGRKMAAQAMQSVLLRLLALLPPGKARFIFCDPVGLGQSVSPFMHLADYDEQLITGKAWTEPQHIEHRLVDLTEHIENVIQKYLRNQYATIEAYDAQAGEIAEPYRLLVVLDFPVNFSEAAARRLISIAQNGPRCGVYPLIVADMAQKLPYGFNLADLEHQTTVFAWNGSRFVWKTPEFQDYHLELDSPPTADQFNAIVTTVGEAAKNANRVEVPFDRIAPPESTWWQGDSRGGLGAPLGPSGARKVQQFSLGENTAQHVLIAGKTGSGKSTLLHTLITSLGLVYSPEELQLYLIDFKKGVEFKTYATRQFPHARVIAIESEREFGLSVLQGLDAELKQRGESFRAKGADHISDYRQKTGEALPRLLLIVDEFQEFFTEDDAISSQAAQILDRLVRQGRAFGVHVLLGSQTLAGSYALARSTIDQMAVRIALQCTEADSRLILGDENPAARLLSRPGEAIYNALNGLIEGNNRFQVAWLPDDEHDRYLKAIRQLAEARRYRPAQPQIVFEGNAPSAVEQNRILNDMLAAPAWPTPARRNLIWLGDPVAIREPVAAPFRRQSGSNLLLIGQNEEVTRGMVATALLSLAAQHTPESADFHILDLSAADAEQSEFFADLAAQLPHTIKVGRSRKLPEFLNELATETKRRLEKDETKAPARYLFLYGLQRARDLRHDDNSFGYSNSDDLDALSKPPDPAQQFPELLRDGPEVGIHTLIWCDTVTNLNRTLEHRALREFAMRAACQMSAEDSANLIDSPAANKLGAYRALFYDEEAGILDKFRPYGLPSPRWLTWAAQQLRQRQSP
ncbi:MAG: FtsK/SpoIIIE domain-containing protein [Anaerolineae bacterium]|nr:FtsK/SpoIIIE domain-containing protein [Anaerolineae bacterium]